MFIEELNKTFLTRKNSNPSYSIRAFARDLEFNAATLSALLNKKRPLTLSTAKKLAKKLNWKPGHKKILIESVADSECFDETSPASTIPDSHGEILAHWETFGILSLLEINPKKLTTKKISESLGIPGSDLLVFLELLQNFGYIESKNGEWHLAKEECRRSLSDVPNKYLREGHVSKIKRALASLEKDKLEERDFSTMTMAIDPAKLPEAKRLIAKFRRELSDYLENDNQQSVYQITIQLIPLTKSGTSK